MLNWVFGALELRNENKTKIHWFDEQIYEEIRRDVTLTMYAIHVTQGMAPQNPLREEVTNEVVHQKPPKSITSKPHPCDRCSKSFSSVHQLSQHTRVWLLRMTDSLTWNNDICRYIPVKSLINVIIVNAVSSNKVTLNNIVDYILVKGLTNVLNVEERLFNCQICNSTWEIMPRIHIKPNNFKVKIVRFVAKALPQKLRLIYTWKRSIAIYCRLLMRVATLACLSFDNPNLKHMFVYFVVKVTPLSQL